MLLFVLFGYLQLCPYLRIIGNLSVAVHRALLSKGLFLLLNHVTSLQPIYSSVFLFAVCMSVTFPKSLLLPFMYVLLYVSGGLFAEPMSEILYSM